jgi:hypothetical protein
MPSFSQNSERALALENVLDTKAEDLHSAEAIEPLQGD